MLYIVSKRENYLFFQNRFLLRQRKMNFPSTAKLIFQFTLIALVFTSPASGQQIRVSNGDLSRTLDTVLGIDIRNGNLGSYKQSKESLVPRSRRTDRENAKIPRNERTEESTVETQNNPVNDDEVKIEDFLTLVKEESNSMPVSYKILTG